MYIIDKNQDYYDYLSYVYGIDKSVTYDRRNSVILNDASFLQSPLSGGHWLYRPTKYSNYTSFVVLEVGYVQYLIKIDDIKFQENVLYHIPEEVINYEVSLYKKYDDNKHYFEAPITLHSCIIKDSWAFMNSSADFVSFIEQNSFKEVIQLRRNKVSNPILKGTKLTKILDAQELWVNLDNYISSLNNDKDIDIQMSDEERAEIHGFDRKSSFRNSIK
jgi:hypothetical protein